MKARAVTIDTSCSRLNRQSVKDDHLYEIQTIQKTKNFSANARLINHTGADLVSIPPSWEVVTKQKIAESRRKLSWVTPLSTKEFHSNSNWVSLQKFFTAETREWSQQLRADIDTLVRIHIHEIQEMDGFHSAHLAVFCWLLNLYQIPCILHWRFSQHKTLRQAEW